MLKTAIIISLIHLIYYLYFQIGSDIVKRIRSRNIAPTLAIAELMGKYKVNVRMFNYNGRPYGFAWFKTIHINTSVEGLRMKNKGDKDWALKWTFHHEHYHLMHNHKLKILLMRFAFSMVPLLIVIHWVPFAIVYLFTAYGMKMIHDDFEKKANEHANQKMKR